MLLGERENARNNNKDKSPKAFYLSFSLFFHGLNMFELSSLWTTILIVICGLLVIFSIVLPFPFKIKKIYQQVIRVSLTIFFIIWIMLFSDISMDSYFYTGSFLGVAFLLKAILKHNKASSIFFSLSFISFTFVFLSVGQTFLFILTLSFSYILFLALSYYYLFRTKKENDQVRSLTSVQKILTGFIILVSVLIFGFVVYYSSSQIITFDIVTISNFFQTTSLLPVFIILFLVLILILIILFNADITNNSKSESEKSWYS